MSKNVSLTRRGVLTGLAAMPVLGSGMAEARLGSHVGDRARDLARRLHEMTLPHAPARLDLVRYDDAVVGGKVQIEAVVRLTWPPGLRSRKIRVEAPDAETGAEAVLQEVYALFAAPR